MDLDFILYCFGSGGGSESRYSSKVCFGVVFVFGVGVIVGAGVFITLDIVGNGVGATAGIIAGL